MNKLFGFATFAVGVGVGIASTWQFFKKKYEQKSNEDAASVKEAFNRMKEELQQKDNKFINPSDDFNKTKQQVAHIPEKPDISEYAKMIRNKGYEPTDYSKSMVSAEEEDMSKDDSEYKAPYVISPDEFGMEDEYDQIGLMYYADHILADDNDDLVEDIETTVGIESLSHFGEYDDDCVYVRNERLKVDYEILRSLKTYSEVLKDKPYLRRD